MTAKEEVASSPKSRPMEPNPPYAEWAAAYQAYYGNGASTPFPCFYPPVPGPQSQPYHWGGQPLMGPYGNPAFPPCPYPYGYVHPTMGAMPYHSYAMPSPSTELVMAAPTAETDAKSSLTSGPKQMNISHSAMAAVANDETRKATSGSECGMGDFSSDRSEEEGTPNEFETTSRAFNTFAKASGNCGPGSFTNTSTEYWSQSTPMGLQGMRGSSDMSAMPLSCQRIVQGQDIWSKDDKESKRQKRKQSNRESARRSRLRKQAESGELSTRVDSLMEENTSLRAELDRLSAECKKLATENEAIMRSMQAHKDGEVNELSDKHQGTQSDGGGFVEEEASPCFKERSIFCFPNDVRTTTLHDLGACALSLMGQDSIAAS